MATTEINESLKKHLDRFTLLIKTKDAEGLKMEFEGMDTMLDAQQDFSRKDYFKQLQRRLNAANRDKSIYEWDDEFLFDFYRKTRNENEKYIGPKEGKNFFNRLANVSMNVMNFQQEKNNNDPEYWIKHRKALKETIGVSDKTDEEIIEDFNKQCDVPGYVWVAARGRYLISIHNQFLIRDFEFRKIGNLYGLSFNRKVRLEDKKVIPLEQEAIEGSGSAIFLN